MRTANWTKGVGVIFASAIGWVVVARSARHARAESTTVRALYGLEAPKSLSADRTALVLVDFQAEFVEGRLPLPEVHEAIEHAVDLAAWARRSGILVVLVQNIVTLPRSPIFAPSAATTAFVRELQPQPGDFVVQKSMMGAFSRTNLDAELRARGIDALILGGLMTHLAVLSTANDATVLGYRVVVAADATATRALPGAGGERGVDATVLQRAALDGMADRVADVMPSRTIMQLPITK